MAYYCGCSGGIGWPSIVAVVVIGWPTIVAVVVALVGLLLGCSGGIGWPSIVAVVVALVGLLLWL